MILVDSKTKKTIAVGDMVKTFNNIDAKVIAIKHPKPSNPAGGVITEINGVKYHCYLSDIGAEFIPAAQNLKRAVGKAIWRKSST